MAISLNGKLNLNNMERASGGATKFLDGNGLVDGDIIALGGLPKESLTTQIVILVPEQWVAGALAEGTIDLGYWEQATETFTPFVTGIQMGKGKILLAGPIDGTRNPDGTAYTGDELLLWNGDVETDIAARYTGSTTPDEGSVAHIVFTHTYYGTKNGKYGLDNIPMTPY